MGAMSNVVLPEAGSTDLRAAAGALRSRLPEPLGPLADIAYNYRWSWTPGFERVSESGMTTLVR